MGKKTRKTREWTPEQKQAFADRMKAGREKAILADAGAAPTPTETTPSEAPTDIPVSAEKQQDPALAAKLAELDEAIRRTNELNAKMEAQEQTRTEKFSTGMKGMSAQEQQHVVFGHESKKERMKEHLAKQPKVRIFIPLEGKETLGTQLPVTLNGYGVKIPKGRYVEVPEQIAEVVTDSLNQTQEAINHPLNIDNADEKKQSALA